MATIASQTITRDGLDPTLSPAAGGGDDFVNTGKEFLFVKKTDAASRTLTFDILTTVDAQAVTDRAVVVPAGKTLLIGPFPQAVYNDPATGKLGITYSAVTNLSLAVIKPS